MRGHRICPGRYFANEALYMLIASVLHVFNIQPAIDENGKPMKVETEIPLDVGVAYVENRGDTTRCTANNLLLLATRNRSRV